MALQRGTGLIFDTLLKRNLSNIAIIEISEKPNHITVSLIERKNLFLYFSLNRQDSIFFSSTINLDRIEESKSLFLESSKCISIDAFILDNTSSTQGHKNSNERNKGTEKAIFEFCKHLLSPAGTLAVAWDNRWSTQNIRDLMRFRIKQRGGSVKKNSYWSMRRKVQGAGFNIASTHAILPNLTSPHRLIATTRSCARLFYEEAGSRQYGRFKWFLISLANLLNIRPFLEPSFVLVTRT